MTSPGGSTQSILRRYRPSYPSIVSSERCDYMHRGTGYAHSLREVVVTCLLVVSNREIAKITVHTDGGRAFYWGNISGDAQAQPVPGERERANLESWLRDDV